MYTEKKQRNAVESEKSSFKRGLNAFLYSPWMLGMFAVLTTIAFIFSLELYYYTFVLLYAICVVLFADDLLPLMPAFIFCYVAPSMSNNPGTTTESIFYGNNGGTYILILAAIAVLFVFGRIAFDKTMGFKRLFCQKRSLLWGMLALGAGYFLGGLGSENYTKFAKENFVFALMQFASVFLLYFLFSATVNWDKTPPNYFAWLGLFVGYAVFAELIYACIVQGVFTSGIRSETINFGWGMQNNIGAMLAFAVPFPFYLACKSKRPGIFLILAVILALSVCLTGSRTSMLGVVLSFMAPYWIAFAKCENKRGYRITSIIFMVIAVALVAIFWNKILDLFSGIPSIFNPDSETGYNDSGRFVIYKKGIEFFKSRPIFGCSFFSTAFLPYDHATVQTFSDFFPPRWHNTTVQMLTCCGVVGMIAYLYHRFDTLRLFVKNGNVMKTMIGIFVLTFVMMSWLDCHFFNIGPTMFYSMALAFAENCNPSQKKGIESPLEEDDAEGISVVVAVPKGKAAK